MKKKTDFYVHDHLLLVLVLSYIKCAVFYLTLSLNSNKIKIEKRLARHLV